MTQPQINFPTDTREIVLEFFANCLKYQSKSARLVRALLGSSSLTLDDIIINPNVSISNASIPNAEQKEKNLRDDEDLFKRTFDSLSLIKTIKPIPEKIIPLRLEHIANNKHLLTEKQQEEFSTAYRSKTDNWGTEFPNDLSSIKQEKISRWERRVARQL